MIKYEYGIFNADPEKIKQANEVTAEDEDYWAFLWTEPIDVRTSQDDAEYHVDRINMERDEEGLLATHGPVKYRRRKVEYGEWEDMK